MDSWRKLSSGEQIEEIINLSKQATISGVVIFKHSTRCSISAMALNRLERNWNFKPDEVPFYFLDLLSYRDISNKIAEVFAVRHESPQLLFIKDGKCLYNATHADVSVGNLISFLEHNPLSN